MEKEKNIKKSCDLCKDIATKICFDCSLNLCDSCFDFLHKKKTNSEHNSETIESCASLNFRCPEHPTIQMNLFCVKEKHK